MGKTIEKVKMWNILDDEKIAKGEIYPLEIETQIDSGATAAVILTSKVAEELHLKVIDRTRVRYANMKIEEKDVVGPLGVEILGRKTICTAIVEPERNTCLIGQFLLELLDLWIDSKNGKLHSNPESPDIPLLNEI